MTNFYCKPLALNLLQGPKFDSKWSKMIKIAPLFGYIGLFLIKKGLIYNQSLYPCCAQRGTQRVILLGAFINCIKIFERGLHPFKEKLLESSTIFDYSYFIYNSGMIHKAHNKIFHSKINAKSKENQNKSEHDLGLKSYSYPS